MLKVNLIADTDGYKLKHPDFVNQGLTTAFSYGEARVGSKYPETVFFGMQKIIEDYLTTPVTKEDLIEAIEISEEIHGTSSVAVDVWDYVIEKYNGYLPIIIKTVPEGTVVPVGNVLFTISTEDEVFAKAINIIEPLLMHVWYTCSVATRSANIYRKLKPIFKQTGDLDLLPYMVNDFGLRGATDRDAAIAGGMAHLLTFKGSDNIPAYRGAKKYYDAKKGTMCAVLASEHTVPLSFGRSNELEYMHHMLDITPDDEMVSILIDTYDTYGFIKNVAANPEIVTRIKNRKGKVIFRPDSGDFMEIIPNLLSMLAAIYGTSLNEDNYVVLNHVGLIQGDGMDEQTIIDLYLKTNNLRWACANLAVGSGGGLLQKDLTRDTQRFAIKMSEGTINGESYNFRKQPSTDLTKTSKAGKLKLTPSMNGYTTVSSAETTPVMFESAIDVLTTVFNGVELSTGVSVDYKTSFADAQKHLQNYLNS